MRDDEASRRSFFRFALVPIALCIASLARAENPESAGAVEEVRGEAFAENGAQRRMLERAAPLFLRDRVVTGAASRLTMLLGRRTVLKLGERARIVIDRYLVGAGGEISLEAGPILFDRGVGTSDAPLQIRSPYALIAVRGTRFFAGPSNGWFGVFVERGSVSVSAAGQQVILEAGQGTNVRWPGAAPTRPARWREARIRAALASID